MAVGVRVRLIEKMQLRKDLTEVCGGRGKDIPNHSRIIPEYFRTCQDSWQEYAEQA